MQGCQASGRWSRVSSPEWVERPAGDGFEHPCTPVDRSHRQQLSSVPVALKAFQLEEWLPALILRLSFDSSRRNLDKAAVTLLWA